MFKDLGKPELQSKLKELKIELIKLNAQVATGTTLKSPSQVREIKKNIARIKALLKEEK
ncbi:50S ribosomal protein L29 [Candidatus Woesearchaeota archaeon]|nr:50S ribosomal protein L29 [Candidatus Woesearchaeota archaeon]